MKIQLRHKISATVVALSIGLLGAIAAVPLSASAHTATVTGSASCTTSTGAAVVTWTVKNLYSTTMDIGTSDNAAIPVGSTIGAGQSATYTQNIAAPAAGKTVSVKLGYHWAQDDYKIPDSDKSGQASATVGPDCTTPDTPITITPDVKFNDVCGVKDDTVTPVAIAHVVYTTDDKRVAGVGTVTVTAAAEKGYKFPDGTKTTFTNTFTNEPCVTELKVTPDVTFTDKCGVTDDTVSPVAIAHVVYTTDDKRVAGVGTVTVTAAPETGYKFPDGTKTTFTNTFTNQPCTTELKVTPDVKFNDVCGVNDDTVTPVAIAHVVYTTDDKRVAGVGTVTVTAAPEAGYTFPAGTKTTFTNTFTNEACVTPITVAPAVTFNDVCDVTNDTITPTAIDHVVYTTNDARVAGVGDVTVTAAPEKGYSFPAGTVTEFKHTFTNEACAPTTTPITVAPAVTFNDVCDVTSDTITPTAIAHVVYTTNDARVAGVGTVTVTAAPESGYSFPAGTTTTFSYAFTNAACAVTPPVTPPTPPVTPPTTVVAPPAVEAPVVTPVTKVDAPTVTTPKVEAPVVKATDTDTPTSLASTGINDSTPIAGDLALGALTLGAGLIAIGAIRRRRALTK